MMNWIEQLMQNALLYHAAIAVVIIAASWFVSSILKRALGWFGKRVLSKTETLLDDLILEVVRKNIRALMIVFGLRVAVREVRKAMMAEDETLGQILEYADAIAYLAVVIVFLKIAAGVVRVFLEWYLSRLSDDGAPQLKKTISPLISKIIGLLLGMVAVIIVLDHFGVNIGSLLVSLGVGSLAVALAAQDTLANMIAGFVILVDRPFRVGDRIELPGGQVGDVSQIGLRSTRILNFDNNLIIVPNAELVKGRITNFSYPHNQTRAMLKVGVAYGVEPDRVRTILLSIADAHPDILKEPKPEVFFTAMNDSSVEFTLVARAADFTKRYKAECDMREQAYRVFGTEGIEIPFPQRVVHMKTVS